MSDQLSRRSLMLTGLTGGASLAASAAVPTTAVAASDFDPETTARALAALRKGNCETYDAVERRFSELLREHCHVILVPWHYVQDATWWLKAYRDPDDWFRKINDQAWLDYQGRRTEHDLRRALGEDIPYDELLRVDFFD